MNKNINILQILSIEANILLQIYFLLKKNKKPSIGKIAILVDKETSLNLVLKITNELQKDGMILKNDKNKIVGITKKGENFIIFIKLWIKLCNLYNLKTY